MDEKERKEILKIIRRQNGLKTAHSIKNMAFTRQIISILEFAGDIEIDDNLQACIEDIMFPSGPSLLGDDIIEKSFLGIKTHEDIRCNPRLQELFQKAKKTGDYQELMQAIFDKVGYFAYIVNPPEADFSDEELMRRQDAIKVYFKKEEALCTFGTTRYKRCFIVQVIDKRLIKDLEKVKKALEERDYDTLEKEFSQAKEAIERSENPSMEDEYNLSVLSIQFGMETGFISIKCRLNHTAGPYCDRTLDSNPNNLHPGLRIVMNRVFGFNDNHQRVYKIPQNYVLSSKQQLVCWHQEKEGIYFSSKCYFKDGIVYPLEDGCVGVEDFIIDKNARAFYTETQGSPLAKVLDNELIYSDKNNRTKRRAIEFSVDKTTQENILMVQQEDGSWQQLLSFKNGKITSLCLPTTTVLPSFVIYDLWRIREFFAPALKQMQSINCIACYELKKIDCPVLESVQDRCFNGCSAPLEFEQLAHVGDMCFRSCTEHVVLPSLKKAGEMCFFKCMQKIELDALEEIGPKTFNLCGGDIILPKLKEGEESCFLSCQGNIFVPALEIVPQHAFNYHKGDIYADQLQRVGQNCFSYCKGNLFLKNLREISDECMCFHAGKVKAPSLRAKGRECFCYTDIFNVDAPLFGTMPVKITHQEALPKSENKRDF